MPASSILRTGPLLLSFLLIGCVTTPESALLKQAAAVTPASNQKRRPIGSARVRHGCFYYTTTAEGKMARGGALPKGTRVTIYDRSTDGWAEVELRNGRPVSIPLEDLATTSQYHRDAARATQAHRSAFSRPSVIRSGSSLLPTPGPPPADFIPPLLPDAAAGSTLLEQGSSDLFPDKKE